MSDHQEPHLVFPTRVPTVIAMFIIVTFISLFVYIGWFDNSQYANLKRANEWIVSQQTDWKDIIKVNPELIDVEITTFIGGGGIIIVVYPSSISLKSELVMRRYFNESNQPRPIEYRIDEGVIRSKLDYIF